MQRDRLLLGLAAVFAGIAMLQFVMAFVSSPALLAVAVPFAAAAYLIWYHATGRLRARVESGRAGSYRRADPETGGFGAGPRDSFSGRRGFDGDGGFGAREARGRRARAGADARGGRRAQTVGDTEPTPREAYRVLGLDADADSDEVRRAYRQRVKSVHPDRESGDEEEFKRVTEAYEVLNDRD
ncbi:J domain-containing protein [Halorussus pelagicus]|uniref:J domain-containing protein n=1 Tax=Halorussus pelagicus TaxID=2505977 RepID=UPI000FFB63CC|nr:J domain-containing protein [Halorussus pelagicus]